MWLSDELAPSTGWQFGHPAFMIWQQEKAPAEQEEPGIENVGGKLSSLLSVVKVIYMPLQRKGCKLTWRTAAQRESSLLWSPWRGTGSCTERQQTATEWKPNCSLKIISRSLDSRSRSLLIQSLSLKCELWGWKLPLLIDSQLFNPHVFCKSADT